MTELEDYAQRIESLARRLGLDYYPVDFELAPASLMTEIAVYGLPVRMPHWSFGVRYIHQLVRQSMGYSKIFEVMFPGDPCRAFLMDGNSLAEIFTEIKGTGLPVGTSHLASQDDVWNAIRQFFTEQARD